jgi:hypothetical protein
VLALGRKGLIACLVLGLVGCGARKRKEAEAAIARAERMVTAVKDRAVKVVPEETQGLIDSLAAAQRQAAAGDHTLAAVTAHQVQADAIEIANSLAGKSTQLSSDFMAFSAQLPDRVERIRRRVNQLSAGRSLPAGIDRARFDSLAADVPSWSDSWKAAVKDFEGGNLGAASAKAHALERKVAAADTLLGLPSAAR